MSDHQAKENLTPNLIPVLEGEAFLELFHSYRVSSPDDEKEKTKWTVCLTGWVSWTFFLQGTGQAVFECKGTGDVVTNVPSFTLQLTSARDGV